MALRSDQELHQLCRKCDSMILASAKVCPRCGQYTSPMHEVGKFLLGCVLAVCMVIVTIAVLTLLPSS